MNSHQIKAICHELADLFGHKKVAEAAGVGPSVWSDYCNYEKPDTTLPLHRMFAIEDRLKRRDFTKAIAERAEQGETTAEDPRPVAARALAAFSEAMTNLTEALADDNVTPAERRVMLGDVAALSARVHELSTSIASLPIGAVRLQAVPDAANNG